MGPNLWSLYIVCMIYDPIIKNAVVQIYACKGEMSHAHAMCTLA